MGDCRVGSRNWGGYRCWSPAQCLDQGTVLYPLPLILGLEGATLTSPGAQVDAQFGRRLQLTTVAQTCRGQGSLVYCCSYNPNITLISEHLQKMLRKQYFLSLNLHTMYVILMIQIKITLIKKNYLDNNNNFCAYVHFIT